MLHRIDRGGPVVFALRFAVLVCGALIAPLAVTAAPGHGAWQIIGPGGGGAMFLPTISPHDANVVFVACDMTGSYLTSDAGKSWRMFNLRGRTSLFAFDPLQPQTMYAYSIGLMRSTDGGLSWQMIYPAPADVRGIALVGDHAEEKVLQISGLQERITALAIDPADSRTLYLAGTSNQQSTLRMSTNWGLTWKVVGSLSSEARAIYVDSHSPPAQRTLYVAGSSKIAVREGGLWREGAAVAGAPFVSLSGGFAENGGKLVVYAATASATYQSVDGGASWRTLLPGLTPRSVATSLRHPQTAYLSYSGLKKDGRSYFGVAVTRDSGATWSYPWAESLAPASNVDQGGWINPTFGPGWGEQPFDMGVSPNDPELCYATDYGRTLRTNDGGKSWIAVYSSKTTDSGYSTRGLDVTTAYGVHFDPFDPRHVFISYTDIGLMRSDDGGVSWRSTVGRGVPQAWRNTTYWMEYDPEVKGRLWAVMSGTHDLPRPKMWRSTAPASFKGGICRSDDGGETWVPQTNGMRETAATHVLLDRRSPKDARVLYVAGFGRGVYKSSDGGASWRLKNRGLPGAEPFAWRLTQDRTGTLYVTLARRSEDGSIGNSMDGALYRSRDGAESWEKVSLPEGVNGPNSLSIDPADPARWYLAAWGRKGQEKDPGGGIFLTSDAGRSWKPVLDRDAHIYDVTIDPAHPSILYACGFESNVWRSADRGASWSRVPGYNFKWGHRVIVDPAHPGMIYVTTFGGSVWHGSVAGDRDAAGDIVPPIPQAGEESRKPNAPKRPD
jgi:photosystem II stability/assembly factor-like uncharacterized protein